MSLDVSTPKDLAAEAKETVLHVRDQTTWLERAECMTVEQLQFLHGDLDKRVAKLSKVWACDDPVVKQLKRLKLKLKDMIEQKVGTTIAKEVAMQQAA